MPHILIRFLTVPDAKTARSSIIWATWIIGLFYLITPILGYGAALFVGQDAIKAQSAEGNLAAPQLASILGGPILFAFVSAVAFATIVAVVAGLVIAASSAFAHDFYTNVVRGGEASEREREQGLQTDYDEIYVSSLTGIRNVEEEIQEAAPSQESSR